jgi:hypothetical protein
MSEQRQSRQNEDDLWYVPISIATKSKPDFSESNWRPAMWLDQYTILKSHVIDGSSNEWVIVNPDARCT